MEYFATNETTRVSDDTSSSGSMDCPYDENSQYDKNNCNNCFGNSGCRTADCKNVCNLDLCEGADTCKAVAIVDLYNLFIKLFNYFDSS